MAMEAEGIILKSFNYGDHHKIIRVLTDRLGMIGIFVNNANKPRSKYGTLAQPMVLASFALKESSGEGDLHFLYGGEVDNYFHRLKLDFENVAYFYEMAEIILRGDLEPEAGPYLFKLLKGVLLLADDGVDMELLSTAFMLKTLPLLGIRPSMDCCSGCGGTENIMGASISQGGIVCSGCYQPGEQLLINAKGVPLFRAMERVRLEKLRDVTLASNQLDPIRQFLEGWYESYGGFSLKSTKILKVLR
ncbi:MAG: DNA repair protein RecO [Turicibacter sp.]|nr:DNA repair protein RecO [Turicibacter sp.]